MLSIKYLIDRFYLIEFDQEHENNFKQNLLTFKRFNLHFPVT